MGTPKKTAIERLKKLPDNCTWGDIFSSLQTGSNHIDKEYTTAQQGESIRGKYAHVNVSSEAFSRYKQDEIDSEQERSDS